MLVSALPPILVLNLKRFRYDVAAGGTTKIGESPFSLNQTSKSYSVRFFIILAAAEAENYFVI
jgi:hypothetical protein